ncbi:MAG: DUF4976 domain-containing protein [Prevotella sp.]|nr:DUF4976 domain-containing protein [Prevotella sp.]MCH4212160.1 DUF4976 domain-containing protein [Prevotella sp.]MCH4241124.1 DUF4976 domain-containing protein [Prevotella sp.]
MYYHYYDYPTFHMVRKHDGVRTERYYLMLLSILLICNQKHSLI